MLLAVVEKACELAPAGARDAPVGAPTHEWLRAALARGDVRAQIQHWGSDGAWPALEQIPELMTRLFLEGAAPRPAGGGAP